MTVFDYLVLIIVAASLLLGLWRGIVGEIIALVAWIVAFLAARWWGAEAARLFVAIEDPTLRLVAGWIAVGLAVLVGMALLRLAVRGLIKALGMTLSDRLLGVIFGVARGLVIVMILVAVGGMTALPKERWWSEAYFSAPLETAVLASKPWLPSDVAKRIRFG
ncbi:MAG: Colicin V production protein [Accumulibacter sp.]|jgi:membrane protein required for colicin V production|uniref:CvpA family protein n=1 Tax=Accumulibacter sp. TaxID=2053492 RepID=UPI00122067DE|nr:CvpA family protein [Accumulibacter sp.]QKS28632.1 MAG: CvpA family protein [Candidatus Accumulibacter similis]TLD43831.1 MAG: Colicin V production protein [Accumulibacter sp.]